MKKQNKKHETIAEKLMFLAFSGLIFVIFIILTPLILIGILGLELMDYLEAKRK
jgi:hypothetical protein